MNDRPLFAGKNCDAFKSFYDDEKQFANMQDGRIPSLLNIRNGKFRNTVIAVADKASCGADWGRIEIAVRRSTDNGETFSDMKTIFSCPVRKFPYNADEYTCAFAIDPLVLETKDGNVIILVDFYPECKGLHAAGLLENGSGYVKKNGKSELVLTSGKSALDGLSENNGKEFTVHDDGFVYDKNNNKTHYYIPKNHSPEYSYVTIGDMYYAIGEHPQYIDKMPPLIPENKVGNDIYVGNIYLSKGKTDFNEDEPEFVAKKKVYDKNGNLLCVETSPAPLRAKITSYIFMLESSDGGKTFSQPRDINPMIKTDEDGTFLDVGPGVGLTLNYGDYNGRMVAPAYILNDALVFLSDDNGITWRRGRDRVCKNIDECQLIEVPDGRVFCFGRPKGGGNIPVSISENGGETFKKVPAILPKIPQCQHSVISLPKDFVLPDNLNNDGYYILLSSPSGHNGKDFSRTEGKVFFGRIEGETVNWIKSYNVKDKEKYASFGDYFDFYAYSCLTVLQDNTIGLLYEAYPSGYITFTKFKL